MKKEIKNILKSSRVTLKWKNCGTWVNEGFTNLLEAAESRNIKITGTNENLKISCNNNIKIVRKTNIYCLERDLILVLRMFYAYLGDKTKFSTYLGTFSIN